MNSRVGVVNNGFFYRIIVVLILGNARIKMDEFLGFFRIGGVGGGLVLEY